MGLHTIILSKNAKQNSLSEFFPSIRTIVTRYHDTRINSAEPLYAII